MRYEDVPSATSMGAAPANFESLLALLRGLFPDYSTQKFNYAGCVVEAKPCRMFAEEPFVDIPPLFSPIPTLEKLAEELMRITNQMNYTKGKKQEKSVKEWVMGRPENIKGVALVAYPIRGR